MKDGKRRYPKAYIDALGRQVLETELAVGNNQNMPHLFLLSTLYSVEQKQDNQLRLLEEKLAETEINILELKVIVMAIIEK